MSHYPPNIRLNTQLKAKMSRCMAWERMVKRKYGANLLTLLCNGSLCTWSKLIGRPPLFVKYQRTCFEKENAYLCCLWFHAYRNNSVHELCCYWSWISYRWTIFFFPVTNIALRQVYPDTNVASGGVFLRWVTSSYFWRISNVTSS